MTEEVAKVVLHNNDTHGKQLSLDKVRSEIDPLHFQVPFNGFVCVAIFHVKSSIYLQTKNY